MVLCCAVLAVRAMNISHKHAKLRVPTRSPYTPTHFIDGSTRYLPLRSKSLPLVKLKARNKPLAPSLLLLLLPPLVKNTMRNANRDACLVAEALS